MSLLVFGHKNPDTDSICSAISLAHLKNELGVEATPYALGEVRKEAQYALDYFGVKAPEVLEDVKIQVKDLSYDKVKSLKPSDSVLNAYNTMIEKGTKTLPVVSVDGKFEGIITMVEIAKSLMYQHFRKVNIPLENVCYNLKGEVLVQCNDVFDGRVTTLSYGMEEIMNLLSEGDIAIVGNRYDIIEYAIDTKVSLLILTGKATLNEELTALAKANGVTVISVDVDTYTASNLINQCAEIEDIITRENLVLFNENDYVDDVKETMLSTNFRAYPVVDDNSKFLGLVSRRHLLNPTKKNVVLVDHNEFAQSADGIEQANIVEIVDHHKIGGISTDLPISVRVSPVGCCSTIIYNLYKENNVEVPKHIAGLLLSAPDFSPCTICLLNISYALSKLSVPIGSNISPIGPISRATYFCFPLSTNDAAFLADFIAESITFSNSYPCGNFNSLHPKVSVVATFAPALKYSLCISTNTSGLSNPNASGFCPACSPLP